MLEDAKAFRKEVRRRTRGRTGTGVRYGPERRRRAVAYIRARQAEGGSIVAASRDLGLRSKIAYQWLRAEPVAAFRAVEVAEDPDSTFGGPILITPSGLRVEGLDLAGLAALLRALS